MNVRHEAKQNLIHLYDFILFGCALQYGTLKRATLGTWLLVKKRRKRRIQFYEYLVHEGGNITLYIAVNKCAW